MKVHCYNILLFSFTLIILLLSSSQVNNQMNHYNRAHMKNIEPTKSYRSLCECELYTSMYDDDPEMKKVMDNFNRQTSQRFDEYNERMIDKRQKCKDQRDKDIQKIILKDKMEKSLAEKVEKSCLMCACGLGGGVAPVWGLVSGLWYATWINYTNTTLVKIATDSGIAEGVRVGLDNVTKIVTQLSGGNATIPTINGAELVSSGYFTEEMSLLDIFKYINTTMRAQFDEGLHAQFSVWVQNIVKQPTTITKRFTTELAAVTNAVVEGKTKAVNGAAHATSSLTTGIIVSIIAIVVIVLVMVIIYLILRYRRKKKMKKKLQYINLLKE